MEKITTGQTFYVADHREIPEQGVTDAFLRAEKAHGVKFSAWRQVDSLEVEYLYEATVVSITERRIFSDAYREYRQQQRRQALSRAEQF